MNPLALFLFALGIFSFLFGLVWLRRRNVVGGVVVAVLGLMCIATPIAISFFLNFSNP